MRIKEKQNDNIITDRNIRDKYVGHYEVLERVKKLLLLPGTELISIERVADYYEVSIDHIKSLYGLNREEIDSDGTEMLPRSFYNGSVINPTSVIKNKLSLHIFLKMDKVLQLIIVDLKHLVRGQY